MFTRGQAKRLTIATTKNHDEVTFLDARVSCRQLIHVSSKKVPQTLSQFGFTVIYGVHPQVGQVFLHTIRGLQGPQMISITFADANGNGACLQL